MGGVETWDAFPSPSGQIDPARCPGGSSTPGLCRINLYFSFLWLWWEGGFDFVLFCWIPPPCSLVMKAIVAPSPRGESSLIRKLVSGARSSQTAHALGAPMSSARPYLLMYSLGRLFVWGGTKYVNVKNFSRVFWFDCLFFFFPYSWHSEWLNWGKHREAG